MATLTDKIILNIPTTLKAAAKKRAHKEGTDLTAVLNQAMLLYAQGIFDPDDFLTKEDMRAIRRAETEVKAGRVRTLKQVKDSLGI